MIDNSIPWPRKGDRLFKEDEDFLKNPRLFSLFGCSEKWYLYPRGYLRAADLLVEHIIKDRTERNFLVYPIVFLYRHYIELELKEFIRDGNDFLDKSENFPACHNLDELWRRCKEIIEKIEELEPEVPKEALDSMEELIHQFSKVDSDSTAFRYPTDKNEKPLLKDLSYIDIENLKEVMSRIDKFLNDVGNYIDYQREMKAEMKAEMEAEYGDSF